MTWICQKCHAVFASRPPCCTMGVLLDGASLPWEGPGIGALPTFVPVCSLKGAQRNTELPSPDTGLAATRRDPESCLHRVVGLVVSVGSHGLKVQSPTSHAECYLQLYHPPVCQDGVCRGCSTSGEAMLDISQVMIAARQQQRMAAASAAAPPAAPAAGNTWLQTQHAAPPVAAGCCPRSGLQRGSSAAVLPGHTAAACMSAPPPAAAAFKRSSLTATVWCFLWLTACPLPVPCIRWCRPSGKCCSSQPLSLIHI